jgi:hypothetical protein
MANFAELKVRGVPLHFAPKGYQADLDAWIKFGALPDDNALLTAILYNDLAAVVGLSGSAAFWPKVHATQIWLWNFAPPKSYGSAEAVQKWARRGGLEQKVLQ